MAEVPTARARPVALPDDLRELDGEGLRGTVRLPHHVRWSGPPVVYDLADRSHRTTVYEQVLCEGTVEEIRRFIRLDDLVDLWPELYLPEHVRCAWAARLQEQMGIDMAC